MTVTLEILENEVWPEPEFQSYLITTCHSLRKKPLDQFTVEDLRIMIGQQISLAVLVPMALDRLTKCPLAEGNFYPGDLLRNVLKIDEQWFRDRPSLEEQLVPIIQRARVQLLVSVDTFDNELAEELTSSLHSKDIAALQQRVNRAPYQHAEN